MTKRYRNIALALLVGLVVGLTLAAVLHDVFVRTSTDASCMSCHVHPESDASWQQSKHCMGATGTTTSCVACHLPPQEETWRHFWTKTRLGLSHLWIYMTCDSIDWQSRQGLEHAVEIVDNASCKACHQNLLPQGITDEGIAAHLYYEENEEALALQCINCHLDAGHYDPNYVHEGNKEFGNADIWNTNDTIYAEPAVVTTLADYTETVPGTHVSIAMRAIPAGRFMMGSDEDEACSRPDEYPRHEEHVAAFFMSETEVTWAQYWAFYVETMSEGRTPPAQVYANNSREDVDAVAGPTPPFGTPDQGWGMGERPAITMTYYAAETFCQWLSLKTGKHYRLPTEREWEYAARGGQDTPYFFEGKASDFTEHGLWNSLFGAKTTPISDYVVYAANSHNRTQEPSAVRANPFGLKNMLGNVMEYCSDIYAPYPGSTEKIDLPEGPQRVVRGGCYRDDAADVRCASRGYVHHDEWLRTDPQNPKSIWWYSDVIGIGFRIVCDDSHLQK